MAVSFIANALGGTTTTTSFSITLPTTVAGDILICEFAHRGTGNGTIGGTSVTTGGLTWTLKHSQLFGSSAFSGKTYWTRATGNHAGQTVTGSSLTDSCAAIVTVYRGALASGDPLADATIVGEQNASGNETQAQITTATAAAWVVLVVVNSPDLAVATQACTSPGTLTERAERLSTGGTDSSIAHASAAKATAGATGALTWTQTNAASGSWGYAIQPAAANNVLVTPGVLAQTLATFAPVVTATANVLATIGAAALSLSLFACTIATPRLATPATLAHMTTTFAPTVTVVSDVVVTPSYVLLATTRYEPTVSTPQLTTISPLAHSISLFAPTVATTANQIITPATLAQSLTTFAPVPFATNPQLVTPTVLALNSTGYAPAIKVGKIVVIKTLALGGKRMRTVIND